MILPRAKSKNDTTKRKEPSKRFPPLCEYAAHTRVTCTRLGIDSDTEMVRKT